MRNLSPSINFGRFEKLAKRLFQKKWERSYLSDFYKNTNYPSPNKGKILLYSALGSGYNRHTEILIYHLLRQEGYEVDYLICDGNLPACEILTKEALEKSAKSKICQNCSNAAKNSLESSNVEYASITKPQSFPFDEKLKEMDLDALLTFEHDGIDFGNLIKGVLYRYFKSLNFGSEALPIAKKYLEAALINYCLVKEMNEKNKYSYFFFSHGIYSTWQPLVEYCDKYNVNYICYDRAKRLGSANFNLNKPSPIWDFSDAWQKFSSRGLKEKENALVEEYLKERELQKNDVYAYNFSAKEKDLQQLKEKLGIKQGAKIITIFTNLIWDAANVSRDIAFQSPLDCILKTINRFKDRNDVHILLRSHPAEKLIGTKERYGNLVKSNIEDLPSNVTIVEPEMNVNSFSVLEISDIGVVHTSTVGLEMSIEGKPVILISDTHYRSKGFTYDAISEENYFSTIENLIKNTTPTNNQVELSKKYFYMMMFEYQKQMPFKFKNGQFNGYSYNSFKEIDNSEPIVRIIKHLEVAGFKDFIFWNE